MIPNIETPKKENWFNSILGAISPIPKIYETPTQEQTNDPAQIEQNHITQQKDENTKYFKETIIREINRLDDRDRNASNILRIIDDVLPKKENWFNSILGAISPTKNTEYLDIEFIKVICNILTRSIRIPKSGFNHNIDKELLDAAIDKLREDIFCFIESTKDTIISAITSKLLSSIFVDLETKKILSPTKNIDREKKTWKHVVKKILENNIRALTIISTSTIKTFGLHQISKLNITDILESLPSILTNEAIDALNTKVTFGMPPLSADQKIAMGIFLSPELINTLRLLISEDAADRPQEVIIRLYKDGPQKEHINSIVELLATNSFLRHSLIEKDENAYFAYFISGLITGNIQEVCLKLFGGEENVRILISSLLLHLTPSLTDENKKNTKNALQFIVGNEGSMHLFCNSVLAICHNVKAVRNSKKFVTSIATCTVSYLEEKKYINGIPSQTLVDKLFTAILPHTGDVEINLITGRIIDVLFKYDYIDYWDLVSNVAELIRTHPSLAKTLTDENEALNEIKSLLAHYLTQEGQEKIDEISTLVFKMIDSCEKIENSNALISFLKPFFISLDEETDNLAKTLLDYYSTKHDIPYIGSLEEEEVNEIRKNIYHATINYTSEDLKNIIFYGTNEGFTLTEERLDIIKKVATPSLASKIISRLEPTYSGLISEIDLAELYATPQSLNNSQGIFSKMKYNLIRIKLKSLIPALVMGMVTYTILYVFTKYSLTFLMASGISMSLATCPLFLFVSPIYKNTKLKDIAKLKGISISLALIAIFSILGIITSNSFAFNPLPYITIFCIATCCLLLNKTHTNNLIRLKRNKQSPLTSAQLNSLTTVDKNSVIRDNTKPIELTKDKTCTTH